MGNILISAKAIEASAVVRSPFGAGKATIAAMDRRLADILRGAVPPKDCGPALPVAPARGPVVAFAPTETVFDGQGWISTPSGFEGRKAARAADVFDLMSAQSKRAGGAGALSASQIRAGRAYRDLAERLASAGFKGSSIEAVGSGSGSGGSFIDALIRDRAEFERMRARIGTGTALAVRRVRPSDRGTRRSIPDVQLVDLVCIADLPLSAVLKRFGWAEAGKTLAAVSVALAAALDRI